MSIGTKFECLSQDCPARQYCLALDAQGVDAEVNDTGCKVPEMLIVTDASVNFSPIMTEEMAGANELIGSLGAAVCKTLAESAAENNQEAFQATKWSYEQVLVERMTFWKAMIAAARTGRQFTDIEKEFYQSKIADADAAARDQANSANSVNEETAILARAAADHATLTEHGLLFDDQILATVDRLVGNLMDGKSTLLVGDKGIAKSQVAKFVAKLADPDKPPVIISGHGDMMSDELMGKMEQDPETRLFVYKPAKVAEAMDQGRPVLLDEVNVGDQTIMMRLQDYLLRRPGEEVMIQENGTEPITIKPGFVVNATANEASARYLHRSQLDTAFRDRFDKIDLRYPDSDTAHPLQDMPKASLRLAMAVVVDSNGKLSEHIVPEDMERLVRLAHITQHLYSVPARDARMGSEDASFDMGEASSNFLGEEPLLTDCITPRVVVETLQRCAAGNKPNMTLRAEMERLIGSLDQGGSTHNEGYVRQVQVLLDKTAKKD